MITPEERTIWPPYEAFYIRSMMFNAQSAVRSMTQVSAVLHVVAENSPEDPVAALPVLHLLGELQNLVLQSAALSRYFWREKQGHSTFLGVRTSGQELSTVGCAPKLVRRRESPLFPCRIRWMRT